MKVYLRCGEESGELLREYLGGVFAAEAYRPDGRLRPTAGDVVLADLIPSGQQWRNELARLRGELLDEVRVLVVLDREQVKSLGRSNPLDDFLVEGFHAAELEARLRRLSRREENGALTVGELEIDEDRYEVRLRGAPVELTYKEFELLRFLAARPGKVFTREVLLEQVWGYEYFGGSRTVDVHVRRIRSKIEVEGRPYIRTVRGVGYIFEP